jgi:hypothetical protein
VAHNVDIGSFPMDGGVDDEAGAVDLRMRTRGAFDILSIACESDQVGDADVREMLRIGVYPECIWLDRVFSNLHQFTK